jgi:hypothetical protein
MELANGLNRFVIHTSVHQPVNDKIPGLSLGPFGQWFTRHETWAEQAAPWIDYLSRSCYMLQQGEFVADIVWFYGEDNNITSLFGSKLPDIPEGFNYDFVNADALINVLSVKEGLVITPSGMSYRLLALDSNSVYMTLPVLRKISELINNGAVVLGPKPLSSPSLGDDRNEFTSIANKLWADGNSVNSVGRGKVYSGITLTEVMKILEIKPDFEYSKPSEDTRLLFVHRKLGNIDFYWINNRNNRTEDLEAIFRVEGKSPELWHPETGTIEQASYSIENGVTKVELQLEPDDAIFIVFRNKAGRDAVKVPDVIERELTTITGDWDLSFQKERGAPDSVKINELTSWSDSRDAGVKYFSGTGTYRKKFDAPSDWFEKDTKLILDLGDVKNIAEVILNGKSLGILWKIPFRLDITGQLVQGKNNMTIKVTNLWVNRLIGDMQPGVERKITYTTMPFYRADSQLKPSGLKGPVTILSLTKTDLK